MITFCESEGIPTAQYVDHDARWSILMKFDVGLKMQYTHLSMIAFYESVGAQPPNMVIMTPDEDF